MARVTTGIVDVIGTFQRFSYRGKPSFVWHITSTRSFEVTYGHLVAIAATILISGVNYVGVKKAGSFQLVFTALKIAMIAAIIFIGFTASTGRWTNFPPPFLLPNGRIPAFA